MMTPKRNQLVIRLSDAALGRIETVTRTTVVVNLPGLGSKVMTWTEYRAEFSPIR